MWQSDSDVDTCVCGAQFSMFVRKHHCRLCGQVFCHACTASRGMIPSFMQVRSEYLNVRLCDTCMVKCTETNKSEPLVRVMALLPVQMSDIRNLALNHRWAHAVNTLLQVYRNLPRKMPYERYSRLETQLLKTHAYRMGGHSTWDIQTVRALQQVPYPRISTCKELGCVDCNPTSSLNIIELLNCFPSTQLLRKPALCDWFGSYVQSMTYKDHVRFMPHWLRRSMTPSARDFIERHIIPLCCNIHVAYAFYYECAVYEDKVYKELQERMLDVFSSYRKDFIYTDSLVQYMFQLTHGHKFPLLTPARLPYDPGTMCTHVNDPIELQSASKPNVFILRTDKGNRYILVKNDDMSKDRLVMLFAHLIERLCETKCVQYPVFVTKTGGWVEMLPKAKTLYELNYELSSHIHNCFPEDTVRCVRHRFIRSAIGACILSYILGVGDRHLQNMVISNGELAHIDFSYLLGHDPKLRMNIRVTPPMIIMMGGENSVDYASFVSGVTKAFHKMRKYVGLWYSLMVYLSSSFALLEIQDHVKRKLMPCLEEADATMRMVDIVKYNSNTWRHSVSDITHQIFQMDF